MSETLIAKELADELNGGQYREVPTKEQEARAREAGLLIVYGSSDDLVEFSGAWRDEDYCNEGGSFVFNKNGLPSVPDQCNCDDPEENCPHYKKHIAENFKNKITAKWCDKNEPGCPSWSYKTDILHETFEIMEGDKLYCRGLVIDLKI